MCGEPRDPLHVEVVRRFVQDQDVPAADEHCCEGDAAPLTARQGREGSVPVQVRDQPGEDVTDAGVACPLVLVEVADDRSSHRLVVIEGVLLVDDTDAGAATDGDLAGIRFEAAGDHGEQARLAVAVSSDDPDSVTFGDAEGHGIENHFRGELEVQRLSAEKMCHPFQARRRAGFSRASVPEAQSGGLDGLENACDPRRIVGLVKSSV